MARAALLLSRRALRRGYVAGHRSVARFSFPVFSLVLVVSGLALFKSVPAPKDMNEWMDGWIALIWI